MEAHKREHKRNYTKDPNSPKCWKSECTNYKLDIAKDASYPPPTSGKMSIYSDGMDRMMSESPAPNPTNIYEVRRGIQIYDDVICHTS